MAREFRDIIGHVHWKDLPEEMEADRGQKTGCGFSTIALGDGVIDIAGVYAELRDAGIAHSTLEIAGADNLKKSAAYLAKLEEQASEETALRVNDIFGHCSCVQPETHVSKSEPHMRSWQ